MNFKKTVALVTLLITVMAFQNCNFQEALLQEVEKKGVGAVDHFLVEIAAHPHVAPGYKYMTRIEAQLELINDSNGRQIVADDRFVITRQTTSSNQQTCTAVYSVSRDEIRTLLKDMEEARVIKPLSSSNTHIMDAALYTLKINFGLPILLSNMNYKKDQLYTTDIKVKDIENALSGLSSNIISEGCDANTIQSFNVEIKERPYALKGYKYVSAIKATVNKATSTNGLEITLKDQFIVTKEETVVGVSGTCYVTYKVKRSELDDLLTQISTAQIHIAKKRSDQWIADAAIYTMQVDQGPKVLLKGINYNVGDHFTTDIQFKDFIYALDGIANKETLSSTCP